MIDKEYIQQLLDKYMQSTTSLEEERILKDFFAESDDVPKEWKGFAVLLGGMARKEFEKRHGRRNMVYPWVAAVAASIACVLLFRFSPHLITDEHPSAKPLATAIQPTDAAQKNAPVCQLPSSKEEGRQQTVAAQSQKPASQTFRPRTRIRSTSSIKTIKKESEDVTDEEIMKEYIEENFTTLETQIARQEIEQLLADRSKEEKGLRVCMNGIGKLVNMEDYE